MTTIITKENINIFNVGNPLNMRSKNHWHKPKKWSSIKNKIISIRESNQKHKKVPITSQYIKAIMLLNIKKKERETQIRATMRD